jgi:PAS domain S-box-containing protein
MVSSVRDYAIFMLDPDGRVASWNEGARRLKGYEQSEILGKHFSVFYPSEDVHDGKLERKLEKVLEEGRVEDEGWRVRKDGSRFWASVVITRVSDADGNLLGFTKVTRDLTERKRADEALRQANESLEVRVRERTAELQAALSARDEFLSIASHELKTPLTALKLQLQMTHRMLRAAQGSPASASAATSAFERTLKQTVALEDLVEDLLDVSRGQTGRLEYHPSEMSVGALVQEIVERFAGGDETLKSRITLDQSSEQVAYWDARRMGQVLMNLLSNAIKYAPDSPIRVTVRAVGTSVEMVVEDHGPGIAPDKQALIFERFERAGASPNVGGLGLGLYITRQIVHAHGGVIRVESQPGKGTRFVVTLPVTPAFSTVGAG